MTEANRTAESCLRDAMNLFTIRNEDDSRIPATMQEIEDARNLLEKAQKAKPDDPEIVKSLEEMETLVTEAPRRKWRGSFLLIALCIFLIYLTFSEKNRSVVSGMFNLPSASDIEAENNSIIRAAESHHRWVSSLPDTDPSKAAKLKAAEKRLTEYRSFDPEEAAEKARRKSLKEGGMPLLLMIYIPLMLALYIYSARPPQYLIWKRQRELQLMQNSGNIFVVLVSGFSMFFLLISMLPYKLFKVFSFMGHYYSPSGKRYEVYDKSSLGDGLMASLSLFFLGCCAIVVIFVFFVNLIIKTLWLIVLFHYVRNYHNDRLVIWKRRLKEKYAQWRGKNSGGNTNGNPALEDSPREKN